MKKMAEFASVVNFLNYYKVHEIRHMLVILNEVKDLMFSPKLLYSSRFFAALRMTTICCSE